MYIHPKSLKGLGYVVILLNEFFYFLLVYQNSLEKRCKQDITFCYNFSGDSWRLYVKTFKCRFSYVWDTRGDQFVSPVGLSC